MVTHVNSRPDEQYQFSKVVNLGPPIHQSKLRNENCNILQRLTISKFCRNGSNANLMRILFYGFAKMALKIKQLNLLADRKKVSDLRGRYSIDNTKLLLRIRLDG